MKLVGFETELVLRTKEFASDWKYVTLGRIVRKNRTHYLIDLVGNVIAQSASFGWALALGVSSRQYAEKLGYDNAYTTSPDNLNY